MMRYSIEITSVPDRERLVAEIWEGDQIVAEINQENDELEIEIYCQKHPRSLALNYEAFTEALKVGKEKLLTQ